MKHSTMNKSFNINKPKAYGCLSICFWLIIWEIMSLWLSNDIIFVSPLTVFETLVKMLQTKAFYFSWSSTMMRIILGFLMGIFLGCLFACLATRFVMLDYLLKPLVLVIKSTPVASFIILALIWVGSTYLSCLIALLMVFPVIYTNVYEGLCHVDRHLLDMATVFEISSIRKICYIYVPSIYPYFLASIKVSLGLSMKSGIAAEVIGIPLGSIGASLYQAKLYLATNEVFALTIVIIVSSLVFEKACLLLVDKLYHRLGGWL